jgi:hypothetical protein
MISKDKETLNYLLRFSEKFEKISKKVIFVGFTKLRISKLRHNRQYIQI